MFGKPNKIINIVIEDYVIRLVETNNSNISSIKVIHEKPIPSGLIENGKIMDEIGFFEFMKNLVKELGIKNRHVRFFVPNPLVIMRQVEIPVDLRDKDITEYFRVEIGKSIHLPFKDPVFDIHYLPFQDYFDTNKEEVLTGTFFAAPRDEMMKYTEIFDDASLKPINADVEALGVYRYFHHVNRIDRDKVYLFIKLDVTSFNISIFKRHQLEFLRYQNLDLHLNYASIEEESTRMKWEYQESDEQVEDVIENQVIELERIMNFYQFSMKKGEEKIDELIIIGDNPYLPVFYQKVNNRFEIPTNRLKGVVSQKSDKEIEPQFIPALGLALKGGA
ncbi:pilus assembly protein PilM [Ornithinibacillus sp. BX22]|uniref:Pilus assembly protein PilM n=1 Tax=Ornithinibacillus hominis TaxID=2763055 RepID=A0A923RIU3_9BACI|nr:pilus assembly protein PilM [Ornithinibacillus hominis]MBC5637460.1 pilus assembly protein PilM [Ornithinibacillus hominis]